MGYLEATQEFYRRLYFKNQVLVLQKKNLYLRTFVYTIFDNISGKIKACDAQLEKIVPVKSKNLQKRNVREQLKTYGRRRSTGNQRESEQKHVTLIC